MEESDRIKALIKGDGKAQKWFYDRFAPGVYAICLRYMPTVTDAEDLLIESLFKAMDKIGQYKGEGSLEGWVKRVAVRECLMALRKKKEWHFEEGAEEHLQDYRVSADEQLQMEDLLNLISQLPEGYRPIFQLYEIEGYKHREIAELLDISIHTSKSQLIMARKRLQKMINEREL